MTSSAIAFLFPGQGSQVVGMGGALAASHPAAKQVFEEVNDALDENLFAIMQNGPDDLVRMTRNAQPALFATSMAAVRVLEAELVDGDFVGHGDLVARGDRMHTSRRTL